MLLLLPVLLLLLGALVIMLLQRFTPGFGYSWLVAGGVTVVVWSLVLALNWLRPAPLTLLEWNPLDKTGWTLVFNIDLAAWQYAFSLVSMTLAVVFTAPARFPYQTTPWGWASSLALTGMGLLAILAGNPLTLVLTWSAIDLLEIMALLGSIRIEPLSGRAVAAFAARIFGTLLVVWAMSYSLVLHASFSLSNVAPEIGLLLLLAVGLRLGVVPLYVPYVSEPPLRRGIGTMLRFLSPAASLVVLGRLSHLVMPTDWALALSVFTALAAVYGGAMWLAARDELAGRPYWLIALAGMAIASVVRGQSDASLVWGNLMLLSGGLVFLYSARQRRILFVPLAGFLGLVGLPFTPAIVGWNGLIVPPVNVLDGIFFTAHLLLLLGYVRHILSPAEALEGMENWIRFVYPLGLLVLVAAQWVIAVGTPGRFTLGIWWPGAASLALTGLLFFFFMRFTKIKNVGGFRFGEGWAGLIQRVGAPLAQFFRLDWAYRLLWRVYQIFQSIIQAFINLLEGDGGVLWSLLMLALLISLFLAQGKR